MPLICQKRTKFRKMQKGRMRGKSKLEEQKVTDGGIWKSSCNSWFDYRKSN